MNGKGEGEPIAVRCVGVWRETEPVGGSEGGESIDALCGGCNEPFDLLPDESSIMQKFSFNAPRPETSTPRNPRSQVLNWAGLSVYYLVQCSLSYFFL